MINFGIVRQGDAQSEVRNFICRTHNITNGTVIAKVGIEAIQTLEGCAAKIDVRVDLLIPQAAMYGNAVVKFITRKCGDREAINSCTRAIQ